MLETCALKLFELRGLLFIGNNKLKLRIIDELRKMQNDASCNFRFPPT